MKVGRCAVLGQDALYGLPTRPRCLRRGNCKAGEDEIITLS